MNRWKGKVAVVTGASSGIGASIAEKLVEHGLQVVGFARRVERIEEAAKKIKSKEGKLYGVKVDVSKEKDILNGFKWVAENLGPVSILVNNAGILQNTTLVDGNTKQWKNILDTMVMGLCIGTREALRMMKANNIDGHIIHINSIAGHAGRIPNFPKLNVYPAAKHAVTALTETLRQELNQLGLKIKITSLSPGMVTTEIFEVNDWGTDASVKESFKTPPFLKCEDIADAILYILGTPPHVQVHELTIKPVGEPV